MKRSILLITLLAFMACEDKKDEISPLIGTWEISNLGEYANANCSGALDYSGWAFVQAFGFKINIVIKEDGTGTMTVTIGNEKEEAPLTWDDSKSQICVMGDCLTYKLDGDSFTRIKKSPCMQGLFILYIIAVYAWPLNLTDTSFETPFCSIVTPYK